MKVIKPVAIGDAQLLDSTIIEQLPAGVSAVSYSLWSANTTYAANDIVCWAYTPDPGSPYWLGTGTVDRFLVAKATTTLKNYEPGKYSYTGSGTLPGGGFAWNELLNIPAWSATTTYAASTSVGRVSGTSGAVYQSLKAANLNNDPASASTWWRQSTANSYATWASGTTYGSGDYASVFFGTRGQVFQSLQAANTNNNPASSPTWWQYLGDTYKTWDSTATYALGDMVIDLRTHHVYESQQATNLNHDPTDTANQPAWWVDLGATNRWAMFDTVTSTTSSAYNSFSFTVALPSLCDTLALLDMVAQSVTVQVVVSGSTVYNQTITLANTGLITDWRRWYFDPLTYRADVVLNDLPLALGAVVTITVTNTGGVAQCGTALFGLANDLGATVYGAAPGIIDFSVKKTDDFGVTSLVQRPFAKRCSFKVVVQSAAVDAVQKFLAGVRAVPCLYQGTGTYASTWIFGFYKDFSLSIDYPTASYLSLEVEGLT